tara:strand:+ start:8 stop:193 length:186 start_codon:yes stop_codon:yes gene_type:complete
LALAVQELILQLLVQIQFFQQLLLLVVVEVLHMLKVTILKTADLAEAEHTQKVEEQVIHLL